MASLWQFRTVLVKYWLGVALVLLAGAAFLLVIGNGLARLSFDVPFGFQHKVPNDLVMVYLDSGVKKNLDQPTDVPLARRFYTQLLQRLTHDGARLVIFDILFDGPDPDPAVDVHFAEAIGRNGHVVLAGDYVTELQGNILSSTAIPPIPALAQAAAGWGIARVLPDSTDNAIRTLDAGDREYPSLGWVAAFVDGSPATRKSATRTSERWLNYYCQPDELRAVNLDFALNGLTNGYFKDKVVVVGVKPAVGKAGAGREQFATPYSRFHESTVSGPSIQAMTFLNLRQGTWMNEIPLVPQLLIVIIWGFLITVLLMNIRPWAAVMAALGCFVAFALIACYVQLRFRWWFPWMAPAGVQTSVALVWSAGYQYIVESRRRKKLRNAFGSYLSPYMADRIADSEFNLALGGKEMEVTVMFTDLEGFTKMSETLAPAEVSRILISYFNQTTRVILEQEGTIIKYIGDAVMAVWGAPLPDPKHAERAVLAAWGMSQASEREIEGRRLRTRLGVNTGLVLAGNLGSDFRFDYTLIGDTVNFAARLEGLNKYLHTNVLIAESTHRQIGDKIKVRGLGKFLVIGKAQSVGIYEVLGLADDFPQDPPWLIIFERALSHFAHREWDQAERLLRETITLHKGADGPAEFYLNEISKTRERLKPDIAWDGSVLLDSK
ncbi:MAG TPA: adenylate/guanylate cyclase domain-containing protein [Candidatus Saccharimonadales bacterium]|nr:adenylate/guanylate cyclase domain-containing protein [Candidatus Saccharimonadales bacterium]